MNFERTAREVVITVDGEMVYRKTSNDGSELYVMATELVSAGIQTIRVIERNAGNEIHYRMYWNIPLARLCSVHVK